MDLRRMATMLVAGVAVVGVSLGVAGCEGSDGIVTQTPTPTVVDSPGPSVSDSSAPPSPSDAGSVSPSEAPSASSGGLLSDEELLEVLPPGAELTDLEGAVVTAEFFLAQYAPMFHTGDTAVWESLSGADCTYCVAASQNAVRLRDDGWKAKDGEIVVDPVATRGDLAADGLAYIQLGADLVPAVVIDPDGAEEVSGEGGPAAYVLKMELLGDIWKVAGVDVSNS